MIRSPAPLLPSRRTLIGGALALGAMPAGAFAAAPAGIVAGTYAGEGGAGLVPLTPAPRGWAAQPALGAIRNASFAVADPRRGVRYVLDEQADGAFGVYDRAFRRLARRSTLGADPCHIALGANRSMLATANYSGGSVTVWRLDPVTGLPEGAGQQVRHQGHGPHARQAAPHAHWVGFTPDGRFLHAVDLGADTIFAHELDSQARGIRATSVAYRAAPGSGPRHLARHPVLPVAYLVNELANTVDILHARTDGGFIARGAVSTLPAGAAGPSFAGHIALDRAGSRLYVSNRGHDSIAVFAIAADASLRLLQHLPSGGRWPRLFLLLEDRREMLVANQHSGTVTTLALRPDGRLHPTGRSVAVPGVAFLGL